jgi:hypothetical protein
MMLNKLSIADRQCPNTELPKPLSTIPQEAYGSD